MKLAFNGATTMRANLETDLKAAHLAGFDFVEIWAPKLLSFLKRSSIASLRQLFVDYELKPLSINSIEHITFRDKDSYDSIKQECQELCSIAHDLLCPYIVAVPGRLPRPAVSRAEVIDESVRVLNELGEIAAAHDTSLAFEFLGQADCSVQTLDLASEIVTTLGRENVGLVIDSFHFYAGGSTSNMIDTINPRQLFIFHINDAEQLPLEELKDCHRLLPGLGILPLKEIIAAFRRIGYDGVASVEIFRPEYWDMDPIRLAHEAKAAMDRVLHA